MRFTPGTPGGGSTVPDGEYSFEVINCEEKPSKTSGNDMFELQLKIKGGGTVYDYLLGLDETRWKLDNFLATIGYEYKPGVPIDLEPDQLIGRRGTCLLYTDTFEGRKKNKVSDYVVMIVGDSAHAGSKTSPKDTWR